MLLAAEPSTVRVLRNGADLPASHVQVTSHSVLLSNVLLPGENHIVVLAKDTDGLAVSAEVRLWAGSSALQVTVQDDDGNPVSSVPVLLELADVPNVSATEIPASGTAVFANVPPTTINIVAQGEGNVFGGLSTVGDVGSAVIRLRGFRPPSAVVNNDFALGLEGWEAGGAPVRLVPHVEGGGGAPLPHGKAASAIELQMQGGMERNKGAFPRGSPIAQPSTASLQASDVDLLLTTSGEGAQSVSRTFKFAPDAGRVRVRYRFVTSEMPAGYFGSQYNDSYSVLVRTQGGGGVRIASNSMNRLGARAFDAAGATRWQSLTLPVYEDGNGLAKAAGDTVQVDVTVPNVGDDEFDSSVVIDFVEQEPLSISTDLGTACLNQDVTFTVDGSPSGTITWTGGGQPSSGSGAQFVTRFPQSGSMTVRAHQNDGGVLRQADAVVSVRESSGPAWAAEFPTSVATADLVQPFRGDVDDFTVGKVGGGIGAAAGDCAWFTAQRVFVDELCRPRRIRPAHLACRPASRRDRSASWSRDGLQLRAL